MVGGAESTGGYAGRFGVAMERFGIGILKVNLKSLLHWSPPDARATEVELSAWHLFDGKEVSPAFFSNGILNLNRSTRLF